MGILGVLIGAAVKGAMSASSASSKSNGTSSTKTKPSAYSSGGVGSSSTTTVTPTSAYDKWKQSNPSYYVSSQDESLARSNPDAAASIMRNKTAYYNAFNSGDKAAMTAANQALNADRERLGGYSGGLEGNAYNVVSPYTAANVTETNMLQDNTEQANALYDATVRQGTDRLNAQRGGINQAFDQSATQSYIQYMQDQRLMPQQLAAAGITGGASESTLLGARAGYETNFNQAQNAKNKALTDIDSSILELQNAGDINKAQYTLTSAEKAAQNAYDAMRSDIERKDTQRQQNIQNEFNVADMTGVYRGAPTYAAQKDAYNQALDLANYTGDFSTLSRFGVPQSTIDAARARYIAANTKKGKSKGSSGGGAYSYSSSDTSSGSSTTEKFGKDYNISSVLALGKGPISPSGLDALVKSGEVAAKLVKGKVNVYPTGKKAATLPSLTSFIKK